MPDSRTTMAYPTAFEGRNRSGAETMTIKFQEWSLGDETFEVQGIPVGCELRHSEIHAVRVLPPLAEGLIGTVSGMMMSDTCMICSVNKKCPIGGYKEITDEK